MKKTLLLVATSIFAAACAAPPTNREPTTTNRSSPEASVPPMTEDGAIAKEKAIWDTIKNKDYDAFAAMLADDQVEVMSEGVMDKAGSVAGVKQFEPAEVTFSDWKFLPIDNKAFLLTYTVAVKGRYQGKEFPLESARASSAWVNRAGKWLAIYHQECAVKPAMPQPPPKSDATKAAASPAVTAAAPPATGPDAIANEKIVWDLFKSKNYDAFAQLLAPNSIEVEPDNVYDRAGTLKGVSEFDASKAVLTDMKAVSLNENASLATYTVKNPVPGLAPEGERHSTIWVKRDAKWLALFHHGGTPVRKPAPTPSPTVASEKPKVP